MGSPRVALLKALKISTSERLRELLKDYLHEKKFQVFTSHDFTEAKEILDVKDVIASIMLVENLRIQKN